MSALLAVIIGVPIVFAFIVGVVTLLGWFGRLLDKLD
jgi:hypothetical protein